MAKRKVNTDETVDVVVDDASVDEVVEEVKEAVEATPEPEAETVEEPVEVKVKTSKTKKAETSYNPEDLIPCRSVTQGRLLMTGPRSKILYVWFNVGDVIDVEYQDLTALMLSRSKYLSTPLFVIEDEDLINQPRWEQIKAVYETLVGVEDVDTLINLPPAQLRKALQKLPKQVLKTLTIEVSTRIENGTYDSINRIKVFDEVCGTDLMCLVG